MSYDSNVKAPSRYKEKRFQLLLCRGHCWFLVFSLSPRGVFLCAVRGLPLLATMVGRDECDLIYTPKN